MSDKIIKFKNYQFSILKNKSILILTTPRTGSNALCSLLEKKTGIINLAEIFHPDSQQGVTEWLNKYQDRETIIKMFPNHTIDPVYYTKLLKNSFIIGLYRRNFLEQVLSYVIAFKTNIYASNKFNLQTTTDAVNISTHELISWAQLIITQRNQYLQNKKHFDIELCYEDIIDDLIDTNDHVKLKKIANYDQLLDELKKLFPEHTYDL